MANDPKHVDVKPKSFGFTNLQGKIDGSDLTLNVDLTEDYGYTKPNDKDKEAGRDHGKMKIVASSGGFQMIPGKPGYKANILILKDPGA
jgi:hypothetical protein